MKYLLFSFVLLFSTDVYSKPVSELGLEDSDINIFVVGVVHAGTDNSVAYIVVNNEQKTYHQNDAISDGVVVSSIYKDGVSVTYGDLKSLFIRVQSYKTIYKNEDSMRVYESFNGSNDINQSEIEHELVVTFPDRKNDFINKNDDNQYSVDRDYLMAMYEEGRLFPYAQFDFDDNGVVVMDVLAGSFFYRAGIRKEDVIKSINGKDIKSFHELLSLTEKFQDTDDIEVEIYRNHKTSTFKYTLESLSN